MTVVYFVKPRDICSGKVLVTADWPVDSLKSIDEGELRQWQCLSNKYQPHSKRPKHFARKEVSIIRRPRGREGRTDVGTDGEANTLTTPLAGTRNLWTALRRFNYELSRT